MLWKRKKSRQEATLAELNHLRNWAQSRIDAGDININDVVFRTHEAATTLLEIWGEETTYPKAVVTTPAPVTRERLALFLFSDEWPDLSQFDFERTTPSRFTKRADAILAQFTVAELCTECINGTHDAADCGPGEHNPEVFTPLDSTTPTPAERAATAAGALDANRSAWLRSQARAAGYGVTDDRTRSIGKGKL